MLQDHKKQYHIGAEKGEIGAYCLLPGDPGRCEKIAAYLDHPRKLCQNREYNIFCGELLGETVTVCSTGIGGPSTAIAVEELAACGATHFIRIGTCGGIQLSVASGDVVIASGAVRQDGTSREYAPLEFPAVADPALLFDLAASARELALPHHVGVVQSKDSLYGQHSPHRMATEEELLGKWKAWQRLGVLASEMEASTLFVVGATLGVHCGAVFLSVWNQERVSAGLNSGEEEVHDTDPAIRVAIEAIKKQILRDREKM
jgi:uridine phosphorylase